MNTRIHPPKGDWRRHHPTATRIAAALLQHAPILALRPRTLLADIEARWHVSRTTATQALRIARQAAAA